METRNLISHTASDPFRYIEPRRLFNSQFHPQASYKFEPSVQPNRTQKVILLNSKSSSKIPIKVANPMGVEAELDYLRTRNAELEREVCERREREGALMVDLERTRERLRFTEEAEERLCMQLGELEAEALEQVHMYQRHIKALSNQLELVKKVLVRSDLASINGSSLVLGD